MKTFLTLLELGPVWDWLSRSQITERPSCDERNAWRNLCALCFSSCHLTSFQNRAPRTQMHITLTPYSHIQYQSAPTRLPSGPRETLGHETIDSKSGVKASTMPRENICDRRQKNGNYAAQRWSQSKFHNRTQNTYGLNEELPQSNNQSSTQLQNSRPVLAVGVCLKPQLEESPGEQECRNDLGKKSFLLGKRMKTNLHQNVQSRKLLIDSCRKANVVWQLRNGVIR